MSVCKVATVINATRNLIIIPSYNEAESLGSTLQFLTPLLSEYDIVIVDDGSSDATYQIAMDVAKLYSSHIHVARLPLNGGIGVAVQTGYLFAQSRSMYEYVIQCDADGQHNPHDIPRLVERCRAEGLDLCIGSRFLDTANTGYRSTFARRLGIRFFVSLLNFLVGIRATDPTSGLRCAGPRAWQRFATHYPEDYPEPESLFWCARNGLKIGEVSVEMRERTGGVSSIRSWRTVYYMAKVTLAILVDRIRGAGK